MEKITAGKAIMVFFGSEPNGRRITAAEYKALTEEDKAELGKLCAEALGMELIGQNGN